MFYFLTCWALPTNFMLVNSVVITIIAYLQGQFYLICVLCVTYWTLSINDHIRQYVVCIRSFINGTLLHPFVPTGQNIVHVGLFTIWLYLMCTSAVLTSWMTLEFYPHANLDFFKCLIKFILDFYRYSTLKIFYLIYILVEFNHISMLITCPLNGICWRLPEIDLCNYIVWNIITLMYLNLGLMSAYTNSYRKYLLSSQSPSLYCALYKPSELVGLLKTTLTVC